jgi:phosphoenolpyruvate carboxykinase (GTP)
LETETTFATVGKEGIPEINMMSIQDFISIPLGKNVRNNLEFGKKLSKPPLIFGVNYFLQDKNGNYLNDPRDKHVWVKWMELRVYDEVDVVQTPTGYIPEYEDLRRLFRQVLQKNYGKEDYSQQFSIRIPENLANIKRVRRFYKKNVTYTPEVLFWVLNEQYERLLKAKENYGSYISPEKFKE